MKRGMVLVVMVACLSACVTSGNRTGNGGGQRLGVTDKMRMAAQSVQIGMTKAQVVSILGQPAASKMVQTRDGTTESLGFTVNSVSQHVLSPGEQFQLGMYEGMAGARFRDRMLIEFGPDGKVQSIEKFR